VTFGRSKKGQEPGRPFNWLIERTERGMVVHQCSTMLRTFANRDPCVDWRNQHSHSCEQTVKKKPLCQWEMLEEARDDSIFSHDLHPALLPSGAATCRFRHKYGS
jgi:hypothetical protein